MLAQPKPRKKVTFHSSVITEATPEPECSHSCENSSDIQSTCAEAGTDDELNELGPVVVKATSKGKKKMASTDDSSDAAPEWTQEEDRSLYVMKSEAKSWAEIGKKLERGRKECQQRYRTLSSHAKELGITTEMLAKLYIAEGDENAKPKSKKHRKGKGKGRGNSESQDNREEKSDRTKTKSKGKSSKSRAEKKKNRGSAETSSSSSGDSNSGSENNGDTTEDPIAEFWAQRRHIYDTLYGQMYPDQKLLRPDRFYSESDCRVLAGLEARYRANKWLYIQADFCNATGRMVEGEILKAKFYEDEMGV
ncbi:hypothetical protein ANO14919_020810 [Xylariales sp. No.14919]|nr:hypothetical protein ANO14919_020810 [Xylariales sp. No.14919]